MSQQSGGSNFRNTDFSDIDRANRPQEMVRQQSALNSVGEVQAYKRRMVELLAPQAGDRLLDAGCGSGADVLALAPFVGPHGRVVGVDRAEVMVAQARERAAGTDLPVEFLIGDILRLDFPDASFDGCRADRVLHHLDDPPRALAELVRVARPGGLIAIFEPVSWLPHSAARVSWHSWAQSARNGPRVGMVARTRPSLARQPQRRR